MITNEVVLAGKFYHTRDTMRRFFGDQYLVKILEQQELIKRAMIKYQCDEINATMKIVELLQQKVPDSGMTQALFIAACVELLEPSSS